mmetsp:Transcript_2682/g.6804  ORF Transcript_2682/g.6804 Transcript_2682/m.6804 type:complete len:253 (+) Transcript_2682:191-949(+)|eukprot:CAMPEP_0117530202 /NCGR_PEP_ID=MMETSP0784-20121206/38222_1 /TAXON_ID=39447 /ORGANISM="" /LENGTH=252 /DNA_ID=CAMNT_0005326539 /DNA_START=175 /DNA_END=933 /DNA_ORIENTATION=+
MATVHTEKIQAFRIFANQLAAQVVEQLCSEYEREVSALWNDVVQYRNELGRLAELLGGHIHRERNLHEMLDALAGHQVSVANTAQMAAQQSPNSKQLHDMVDQLFGQQHAVMNTALQGVSQARAAAETHVLSARQLQEPLVNAENEYNRIIQMLSQPSIVPQAPAPTSAPVPRTPPMTPGPPQHSVSVPPGTVPSVTMVQNGQQVTYRATGAATPQYVQQGPPMQVGHPVVVLQPSPQPMMANGAPPMGYVG